MNRDKISLSPSQNLHQSRSKMPHNSAGGYYVDGLQDSHASRMTYLPLIHPLCGTISLTRELPTLRPRETTGHSGSVDFKTLRPNSIPGRGLDLSAGRGRTPATLEGRVEPSPHTSHAGTGLEDGGCFRTLAVGPRSGVSSLAWQLGTQLGPTRSGVPRHGSPIAGWCAEILGETNLQQLSAGPSGQRPTDCGCGQPLKPRGCPLTYLSHNGRKDWR